MCSPGFGHDCRVEPLSSEDRHEARTVEIALAVMLGIAIVAVPTVGAWLLGWTLALTGPGWEAMQRAVRLAAVVLGTSVTLWWLVRARRRGL